MNSDSNFKIVGSGKLWIGEKVIEFENKVNSNFLVAPQFMLDKTGFTKQQFSAYEPDYNSTSKFSVLEESTDATMTKAYTDMGTINISNFNLVQASFLKSTIRASGNITQTGTIRSAGFNVATKLPSPSVAQLNVPYRRTVISLTGSTTVSVTSGWIYNDHSKALYNYKTSTIYKIPYDIDTGTIGKESIISTNWKEGGSSSYFFCTDGINRVFIQTSGTTMKIFDMATDTVTDVTLSESVTQWLYNIGWDETNGVLRSYNGNGFTIAPDGKVTTDTGGRVWGSTSICVIRDSYIMHSNGYYDKEANISSPIIAQFNHVVEPWQFIKNSRKEIYVVDFPNASPSSMTVFHRREPDSSQTILTIPTTNVTIGESFGIEYSFTVVDGR